MKKILKIFCATILIFSFSFSAIATTMSDNDGSAFITKAEFDALKSSFQAQIDTYNRNIDSKIDAAIASYLSGIRIISETKLNQLVDVSRIEWTGALASTIKNANTFQYQIMPDVYYGFGTTSGGWAHWVEVHWEQREVQAAWPVTTPVNYGGYYLLVDDRTLSTSPYLYELRKATPQPGYSSTAGSQGRTVWKMAKLLVGDSTIRGAQCIIVAPKDNKVSFTATVDKGIMQYTAKWTWRYAANSHVEAGNNLNKATTIPIDIMSECYTTSSTIDYKNKLFCCLPSGTSATQFPLYDNTNKFNWTIAEQDGVKVSNWNIYAEYTTLPTDADVPNVGDCTQHTIDDVPYPKMSTDNLSNRNIYTDFYSNVLYENGYPDKKMTGGSPFLRTDSDGSTVKFKIKNTASSVNAFFIKEGEFTSVFTQNGINMIINGVDKINNSGNIAAGATVDVEFEGKKDAVWWFKSMNAGKWEVVGDIIEKNER